MSTFNLSSATPFVAIHAGEFLRDELDARGMTQKELSDLTGIHSSTLNEIIKGKRGITAEQSSLIGVALGIEDDFFFRLQFQYEMDKTRLSEKVKEEIHAVRFRTSTRSGAFA